MPEMSIYLDMCCLKRPFDNQIQPRLHLESEAVLWILKQVDNGRFALVNSGALKLENDRNPNLQRRSRVTELLGRTTASRQPEAEIQKRAEELGKLGFKPIDALHVASAEQSSAKVLLSCDDRLLNAAARNQAQLKISVLNPIDFVRRKDHEPDTDTSTR